VTDEEKRAKPSDVPGTEGHRFTPASNAADMVVDEDEDEVEGHRLLQSVEVDSDNKEEENDDVEGHRLHHGHH
jgi:hypothetical protein